VRGKILKVNETQPFIKIGLRLGLRLVVQCLCIFQVILANHWFRNVNDVPSEPMSQMPLEP